MADKKRINWLLILQGWAMLWVVIGHAFLGVAGEGPVWENALFHFAYSFHMPLFMLVSGWLFYLTRLKHNEASWGGQKWTYSSIIKDKTLRLLLPGLVFSLLALALKLAFPGEMSRQVGISVQELIHSYVYPNDNPMRELWFIATLFWLFLLTPLWKIVLKREWTVWGTMIVLAVLHFWHPDIELLCLGRVFNYGIWFYLGVVISKQDWVDNYLVKQPWLVLLSGIVAYVIGYFTIGFVTTLGGIVLSFGLALLLDKYLPRTFATFRDYTYQIFLMGIFAQMLVKIVYRHISLPYFPTYLVCIAVGLYVPVVISKIIEKINWKPLSLSVGLK
ncbi:MAG: acyltransferase [Bacteroidales bacterium]|nr:acyltransferase [Bacteroidales bacterium]